MSRIAPKQWLIGLGTLSTVFAVLQLFPYTVFLRMACQAGAVDYIWAFTCFGGLNFVYIWHNIRLISMLRQNKFSMRTCGISKVWFYSGLAYVLLTVVQVFWWAYCRDILPLVTSAVSLPFCCMFFAYGTRTMHAIRQDHNDTHRSVDRSMPDAQPINTSPP